MFIFSSWKCQELADIQVHWKLQGVEPEIVPLVDHGQHMISSVRATISAWLSKLCTFWLRRASCSMHRTLLELWARYFCCSPPPPPVSIERKQLEMSSVRLRNTAISRDSVPYTYLRIAIHKIVNSTEPSKKCPQLRIQHYIWVTLIGNTNKPLP